MPGSEPHKCIKCGLELPSDQHTRWTPLGYEHDICPTPLVDLHPSGFTQKQVYYSQLLVKHIREGGSVNLVRCKKLDTGEIVEVLCLVGMMGVGLAPIAIMFRGDGTDEVEIVMAEGEEKPTIMGRKANG